MFIHMNILYLVNKLKPQYMKNRIFTSLFLLGVFAGAWILVSCEDDTFNDPTISLSSTAETASSGDVVTVDVTAVTDAELESFVVTKLWDGTSQNVETMTTIPTSYSYTVVDADAEHVVTINFTVTDKQGKSASVDLVITIKLTPRQLLLKYNWKLSEEIRVKTGTNDISDVYTDDVYRFNADGTYNKSIGEKVDDFGDIWYNYCYYDLNDNTLKLLMSRTGAFAEEVTDTLRITVIDDTKLYANVNYIGLEVFDPNYDHVEKFEKRLVAVAKTNSFDPYLPGSTDDATGPANMCADVTFEND